jgi:hypothetical protein
MRVIGVFERRHDVDILRGRGERDKPLSHATRGAVNGNF